MTITGGSRGQSRHMRLIVGFSSSEGFLTLT